MGNEKDKAGGKDAGGGGEKGESGGDKKKVQEVLASLIRAALHADLWILGRLMLERMRAFRAPSPRGRILMDLSRAEYEVWEAVNVRGTDPVSKMLLDPVKQEDRVVQARCKSVRLCEQCIMAAKRTEHLDLVEESALSLWYLARPLLCDAYRVRIHKSLQRCVEILDELKSNRLTQLIVQLHYEVARCEVAQDLLTKGQAELRQAAALDYTLPTEMLAVEKRPPEGADPAPYVRPLQAAITPQLHLLQWKLALYEEPTDPADQAMLLLDQVQSSDGSSGALIFNLLSQAYEKLDAALEETLNDTYLQSLATTCEDPPKDIGSRAPLQPLPAHAPGPVKDGDTSVSQVRQHVAGSFSPRRELDHLRA